MKKVIVTGAASGIGAAATKQLRESGASVIALDRNEPASGTADEFIAFDQSSYASIEEAVKKLPNDADGLLNIAGVAPSSVNTPDLVMMINFYGLRHFTEQALEKLPKGAAIVNLASAAGMGWPQNVPLLKRALALRDAEEVAAFCTSENLVNTGMDNDSAYAISKQLVIVWTAHSYKLWQERGIRMNGVAPSAVETPILGDFIESFGSAVAERIKMIGPAQPEDIAKIAVMLLHPDFVSINGATIPAERGAITLKGISAMFG